MKIEKPLVVFSRSYCYT